MSKIKCLECEICKKHIANVLYYPEVKYPKNYVSQISGIAMCRICDAKLKETLRIIRGDKRWDK